MVTAPLKARDEEGESEVVSMSPSDMTGGASSNSTRFERRGGGVKSALGEREGVLPARSSVSLTHHHVRGMYVPITSRTEQRLVPKPRWTPRMTSRRIPIPNLLIPPRRRTPRLRPQSHQSPPTH